MHCICKQFHRLLGIMYTWKMNWNQSNHEIVHESDVYCNKEPGGMSRSYNLFIFYFIFFILYHKNMKNFRLAMERWNLHCIPHRSWLRKCILQWQATYGNRRPAWPTIQWDPSIHQIAKLVSFCRLHVVLMMIEKVRQKSGYIACISLTIAIIDIFCVQ